MDFADHWGLVGTHGSRIASGVIPSLDAEALTLKHEFGCVANYSRVALDHFAREIFRRELADGTVEDVWANAVTSAAPICARSDVQTLVAGLWKVEEAAMYPILVALGDIIMMYDAQVHQSVSHPVLPPDPFVEKVQKGRKLTWAKTTAAKAYAPHRHHQFTLVDTHLTPLGGLHVEEK